jgi:uncharacterized protein (UPF0333 family)
MGLVLRRRGQISLEFLFVFAILMIMLLYSAKYVTFNSSTSAQTLAVQTVIEEKSVANVIGSAIDQVYAQGPGAKVTVYARFSLLRNTEYLKRAFNLTNPVVYLMLIGENSTLFPPGAMNSVIAVGVADNGTVPVLNGADRTGVWVQTFLKYNSTTTPQIVVPLNPSNIPPVIKVVVQWDPAEPVSMVYNSTTSTLEINIRVENS